MGGNSSSTRRITIEEDDGPGMVKISSSVVRRLKGEAEIHGDDTSPKTGKPKLASKSAPMQSVDDLKRIENMYHSKFQQLEKKQAEMYRDNKDQFTQAVEEVEKKFVKQTFNPVCQDLQQAVLECYQKNPKQSLLCSTQVKDFMQCVEDTRKNVLTRKG
ncbi:MICOS complex subunit mic25a-like [Tubulanus polymorphus]|uniref:MICOS complex subunit mic25a-like n=1 Tax=Tubulanus polymorphus TaxID=672921 RepID=UPI003DA6786C